jgi:hypothetical protein
MGLVTHMRNLKNWRKYFVNECKDEFNVNLLNPSKVDDGLYNMVIDI